ncbi:dihydrolipoyl dehydrogenase family protein [Candidatus Ruminimicrobium bovinum]|uniref:dihydrolipoyl dehydrogenase family protein n=1 Tax=Candidatus Ruminimicrobium bovinum TaxID=3242779 RepID=UPI0039B9ABBF
MENKYDVAVIGAGPAGYTCAVEFAKQNLKTVIIEKENLGGTCLNNGCIPTKFLWQVAKTKQIISKSFEYALKAKLEPVNFSDIINKKNKLVANLSKGIERLLTANNVDIIKGFATFKDKNILSVKTSEKEIEVFANKIIIAAGSQCKNIAGMEFDHKKYINSTDALNLTEIPKTMLVIGAGAIGVELSSIFSCFGTDVTLREICPQILPSEDTELAFELTKVLARQGIKVEVSCTDTLKDKDKFEKILIVAGRQSSAEGLNIENIKLNLDNKKFIETKNYVTNIDNVYAIGDVTGKGFLAYTAEQDGINAAKNLLQNNDPVPKVVFSFPPSASVKSVDFDKCDDISYGKVSFSANARAQIEAERTGWVKVAIDNKTKKIKAVWILGANADELINIATVIIKAEMTITDLSKNMFFHPGLAELILEAVRNVKN